LRPPTISGLNGLELHTDTTVVIMTEAPPLADLYSEDGSSIQRQPSTNVSVVCVTKYDSKAPRTNTKYQIESAIKKFIASKQSAVTLESSYQTPVLRVLPHGCDPSGMFRRWKLGCAQTHTHTLHTRYTHVTHTLHARYTHATNTLRYTHATLHTRYKHATLHTRYVTHTLRYTHATLHTRYKHATLHTRYVTHTLRYTPVTLHTRYVTHTHTRTRTHTHTLRYTHVTLRTR